MIGKRFSFIVLGKHNQAGMSGIVYLFFQEPLSCNNCQYVSYFVKYSTNLHRYWYGRLIGMVVSRTADASLLCQQMVVRKIFHIGNAWTIT